MLFCFSLWKVAAQHKVGLMFEKSRFIKNNVQSRYLCVYEEKS